MNAPIQSTRGDGVAFTSAHRFRPYRRWFNHGRCFYCILHERHHPTRGLVRARQIGNSQVAVDPDEQ